MNFSFFSPDKDKKAVNGDHKSFLTGAALKNASTNQSTSESISLQPGIGTQSIISIMQNAFDLPKLRQQIEDLEKDPKERTYFKDLSTFESKSLKDILMMLLSIMWEKFFNDLDPTNPDSVEMLRAWNSQSLQFPVSVKNLEEPNERFMFKALQMLETSAQQLETVQEVDDFFDRHNGTQYFPFVDEKTKKFSSHWAEILHKYAAKIAENDIQPCLVEPPMKEVEPESVDSVYNLMIEAEKIINRRILSTEVRENFLKKFSPILESEIDYFHKFSKVRKIAGYLQKALDIRYELYETPPPEVLVEEVIQPPAEETTEVPKEEGPAIQGNIVVSILPEEKVTPDEKDDHTRRVNNLLHVVGNVGEVDESKKKSIIEEHFVQNGKSAAEKV